MSYMDFSPEGLYGVTGKVVVISCGSDAVARVTALMLDDLGAKVVCLALKADVTALAKAFKKQPGIRLIETDVTDPKSVDKAFETIASEVGKPYAMLNLVDERYESYLTNLDPDAWQKLFDRNVRGTVLCTKAFGRYIGAEDTGRVVNLSSLTAVRAWPTVSAYGMSKAAVDSFTWTMAAEWLQRRIEVNAVAPSYHIYESADSKEAKAEAETAVMQKVCTADKVAAAILYLIGPNASFLTGEILGVDGAQRRGELSNCMPDVPGRE